MQLLFSIFRTQNNNAGGCFLIFSETHNISFELEKSRPSGGIYKVISTIENGFHLIITELIPYVWILELRLEFRQNVLNVQRALKYFGVITILRNLLQ